MASKSARIGMVALALILAGGIGYFVYSNSSTNSTEVPITIGAGSVYFTPTSATVTLGQTVTMVVFNTDNNPHSFSIQAFNASTGVIQPGKTGRATFVANQAGDFPFYSPLSATDAQGMTDLNGTLTVKG
jgi:plastocyanin